MFRRHQSALDGNGTVTARTTTGWLAAGAGTMRTTPRPYDPRDIRGRLVGSATIGLRARMAEGRLHTA